MKPKRLKYCVYCNCILVNRRNNAIYCKSCSRAVEKERNKFFSRKRRLKDKKIQSI